MAITYTNHLQFKLKALRLPRKWPREIIMESSERYYDQRHNNFVAVSERTHERKVQEFAVAYDEDADGYRAITVYDITFSEKQDNIESKRWIRL